MIALRQLPEAPADGGSSSLDASDPTFNYYGGGSSYYGGGGYGYGYIESQSAWGILHCTLGEKLIAFEAD